MDGVECFIVRPLEGGNPRRWCRVDTGELYERFVDIPAGAIWEASWMDQPVNGDGPTLVVKLPNGLDWMPGSQSNNCTRPGEDHDCWCVHGEAPNLTVDKTPEPGRTTCAAGAGSIGSGKGSSYWHGFLRDGHLVVA